MQILHICTSMYVHYSYVLQSVEGISYSKWNAIYVCVTKQRISVETVFYMSMKRPLQKRRFLVQK